MWIINQKKPTTYVVKEWDEQGKLISEEAYPMHLYTLDDVIKKLEGKEEYCDIYECRYSKRINKYITIGCGWYEWNGIVWESIP